MAQNNKNTPVPIADSSRCTSCGEIISSDCVGWAGGVIPGITICKGASITDVITAIGNGCCGGGGSPVNSCAAAGWTDLVPTIVRSGSSPSASYTVLGYQTFDGPSGFPAITNDNPMFRLSNDGDVKMRGVIRIEYNTGSNLGYVLIDLGTVPASCLPTSFLGQVVLTEVDFQQPNKSAQFMKAYAVLNPNGLLQILVTHDYSVVPYGFVYRISLGGVVFNIT